MPTSPASRLIDQLLLSVPPGDGERRADGELLTRFVESRDDTAFAALVRRHGPLVWGVCGRALHNHQDAEDAFQATFLVLVRKAASVSPREMVANWLYGVARQATLQARRTIARRRGRKLQVTEMPDAPAAEHALAPDVQSVLDEELVHLPDIYRAVVVLCDLEGRTRREVARQLGVPDGTVGGRLARARAMLAKRLARRGVTLPAGALGAVFLPGAASATVPKAVVLSTIKVASLLAAGQAATAAVPVEVAALTEGVLKTMLITKIKAAVGALLLVAAVGCGAGILCSYSTALGQQAEAEKGQPPPAAGPVGFTAVESNKQSALNAIQKAIRPGEPPPPAVKPERPAAKELEKEMFTAWGKQVDGLQGGLGYPAGRRRAYRIGETVTIVARVRNAGKAEITIAYRRNAGSENPPAVTDADGKPVGPIKGSPNGVVAGVTEFKLPPGTQADLYELNLALLDTGSDEDQPWALHGTGTFRLGYDTIPGIVRRKDVADRGREKEVGFVLNNVATGKLALEVQDRNPARGPVEQPAAKTLLKQPDAARRNMAVSPKFDPRVFVYRAESISGKIEEHNPDGKEIALNVGARDGVHFGYAFQIVAAESKDSIGVAKVVELEPRRCVARVVTLNPDNAARSLNGLTAVCAAPQPDKNKTAIESRLGKNIWQTESLENKVIRGLLETSGDVERILIVHDK